MLEDISIKINPYLGLSQNLIDFFIVLGYEEKLLKEYFKNNNLENDNLDLEITVISSVISSLTNGILDPDKIIKQIYPDKPKIIKIKEKEKEKEKKPKFKMFCLLLALTQ